MTDETSASSVPETDDIVNRYSGSEPVFGMFSQTKVILNGIRLTIRGKVFQNVGDLGSDLETARREFLHDGNCVRALQAVARVHAQLGQRNKAWEYEAQRLENNRLGQSGDALKRMRAEHSRVRNNIFGLNRMFSKLATDLNQICSKEAIQNELGDQTNEQAVQDSGEHVDLFELGRPQRKTSRTFAKQIREELLSVVGESLELVFSSAKKVVEKSNHRETAWDLGKNLILVAGWYPTDEDKLNVNEFVLRFWLIPKSPDSVWGIDHYLADNQFQVFARETSDHLNFEQICWQAENIPQSPHIGKFIKKLYNKRFESQSNTQPTRFRLFYAQTQFANEASFNCVLKQNPS